MFLHDSKNAILKAQRDGEAKGRKKGREEGIEEGEKSLILRLLTRRVGELPQEMRQQIESLSREQLENLGEALLDFQKMADLQAWLETSGSC
jgi:predicted transposase YdaD